MLENEPKNPKVRTNVFLAVLFCGAQECDGNSASREINTNREWDWVKVGGRWNVLSAVRKNASSVFQSTDHTEWRGNDGRRAPCSRTKHYYFFLLRQTASSLQCCEECTLSSSTVITNNNNDYQHQPAHQQRLRYKIHCWIRTYFFSAFSAEATYRERNEGRNGRQTTHAFACNYWLINSHFPLRTWHSLKLIK